MLLADLALPQQNLTQFQRVSIVSSSTEQDQLGVYDGFLEK